MKNASVCFFGNVYQKNGGEQECGKEVEGSSRSSPCPSIPRAATMEIPGKSNCQENLTYEVKSGEPLEVEVAEGQVAFLIKAKLEENCKENHKICSLYLTLDGKRLGAGSLHPVARPEHKFQLVLDRSFQFSHTLSNGIVFLSLSKAVKDYKFDLFDEDDEEQECGKEVEGSSRSNPFISKGATKEMMLASMDDPCDVCSDIQSSTFKRFGQL